MNQIFCVKKTALLIVVFILGMNISETANAQTIPFIKANSKEIKILDGDDLQNGVLVPQLKLDVYPYHKSGKTKTVTYITDIDSISFSVKPGDNYTFGIILNNRDTCYQQLASVNPNKPLYHNVVRGSDTIQFTLGANN